MHSSLGAGTLRNHRYFESIPGSASSSEIASADPMFSSSSTSSHTSTIIHLVQQRATSYSSHHSQTLASETSSSLSALRHNYHDSSLNNAASLPTDTPGHHRASPESHSPADSRFDSLHELLERAGYKETRVVTPDRQTLAGMFAKKLATPPKNPRLVDDFSSDSPSLAACELRRAIQKSATTLSTPKAAHSKSLPSRNYKLSTFSASPAVPPLPDAPAPSSNWFSNIWFFGPGTTLNDPVADVDTDVSSKNETALGASQPKQDQASRSVREASTALASPSNPASTAFQGAPKARPKRTASSNPVWMASVAYRSSKSHTAPLRSAGNSSASSNVLRSNAAAEEEWKALQKGGSDGTSRKRPGLVDAFSSPTKKATKSDASDPRESPSRQRKWRQERAAWRESLGDLKAMMDQSRLRCEARTAAAAPNPGVIAVSDLSSATPAATSSQADSVPTTRHSDEDAVARLLSGPALPFLSTDPAVAPRNGSCTRPTHLSMRRMKSVEVLSKIIRERRTISSSSSSSTSSDPTTSLSDTRFSLEIDTEAAQISPSVKKRSTPPRLTVSSPRGISSPKEIALEGHEFEPMSWSPGKSGGIIISNRKVHKKPRSKLRHVSSGSDLRSIAASEGLRMPKRGRSKFRASPDTSPSKTTGSRGPIAAILRESVGSLTRGSKVQALRSNVYVFDESESARGVDDSPTRMSRGRTQQRQQQPLVMPQQMAEVDDIFRPSPSPSPSASLGPRMETMLKKKDFSARITRTSKIMRLIEEAENIPTIASMILTQPGSTTRTPLQPTDAAPQPIPSQRVERHSHEEHGLSSSLSKKSRQRMHTITRVLGEKQPAN